MGLTENQVKEGLREMGVPIMTILKLCIYHMGQKEVYQEFRARALKQIKQGATHLSAKHIMEQVRAETKLSIKNEFTSYYGRVFVIEFPQYKNLFDFKEVKGLKAA